MLSYHECLNHVRTCIPRYIMYCTSEIYTLQSASNYTEPTEGRSILLVTQIPHYCIEKATSAITQDAAEQFCTLENCFLVRFQTYTSPSVDHPGAMKTTFRVCLKTQDRLKEHLLSVFDNPQDLQLIPLSKSMHLWLGASTHDLTQRTVESTLLS